MNHTDHVNLIRKGITRSGGIWADIGSGDGAFTLALAELLGSTGQIISVDRNGSALKSQQSKMKAQFPNVTVSYKVANYANQLDLPPLDGILMANSLHFCEAKKRLDVLELMRTYLQPGGRFILVEYDTDKGNRWVPYPLSFHSWQAISQQAGLINTTLLATRPSRFLGQIYASVSTK